MLSHAAGVGAPLDDAVVRLVLALKAASLARGASGVRLETVEALLRLYNQRRYPRIPAKGSVGASGDLAPLAHLALALLGVGEVCLPEPLLLAPKEGLALLNGTQVSTALALLIDSSLSGLPPFLVEHGGVNSGFMVPQVTAAALASENKSLAHPASVDSMPTSANQEDHVSMATFAARRLTEMAANSAGIVAIELLAAAQGIDFRAPLKTSPALAEAHALVRSRAAFYDHDRYFAPDIAAIQDLVASGAFRKFLPGLLPSG